MISASLLFQQGRFLIDGAFRLCDVRVHGSMIAEIDASLRPNRNERVVPLNGCCVVPGLINSHDHLEFNLFPKLGKPRYKNYIDWSEDLQSHYQKEIREVLKVPMKFRLAWGAYKNIFSGVTTVVHHNRYDWRFRVGFPIEVYQPYRWIHSLALEKRDLTRLLSNQNKRTFIHLAEGIDSIAEKEFGRLVAANGLTKHTVVIHGIALTDEDIEEMRAAGSSLIWCPSSNLFLFGKTAPVEKMFGRIPVALGTDSILTGSLSLFDEMRIARSLKKLTLEFLTDLVTKTPATILGLRTGKISRKYPADLLFFEANTPDPFDSLLALSGKRVALLLKRGRPIFGDSRLLESLLSRARQFSKFEIDGRPKFVVGDFPKLIRSIEHSAPGIVPPPIHLN